MSCLLNSPFLIFLVCEYFIFCLKFPCIWHYFHNNNNNNKENFSVVKSAKQAKEYAKKRIMEMTKKTWEKKPMHGQYPDRVKKADVDKENTHKWLRSASLKEKQKGSLSQHRIRALPQIIIAVR